MLNFNPHKVEDIVREVAATEIMPRFRHLRHEDISYKIGDDPVTTADKSAESILSERLCDLLPGSKAVGEEACAANQGILDCLLGESPVWIIDPVDGTRNFVEGSTTFGVIVALAQRNQTIAGWLYHPASDEFVTAELGSGAYHNGNRLKVLPKAPLEEMTGALGLRITQTYEQYLLSKNGVDLAPKPKYVASMRACCHDFPRLVVGYSHFGFVDIPQWHFRALLQTCSPWDDAAGLMIHAESGGYSAHWDGTPFMPSSYEHGFMAATDKESWLELKNWISTFCEIPK
ncbi:MAG: inositol monophosphatase [Alphaproteobacteria bacterium]|nr:inositol monophosphatase [Alphaproteobacteria bacterium]